MKSRLVTIILYASLVATAWPQNAQQSEFSAEDQATKNSVALPPDVLALLKEDKFVRETLEDRKAWSGEPPRSWFSASAIRLGPRSDDLIVRAEGPLLGANATSFWIFLTNPHGHRLALNAPTSDLKVEDHRTNGYRDITLASPVAGRVETTTLRFNGHEYVLYRQKSEPIR